MNKAQIKGKLGRIYRPLNRIREQALKTEMRLLWRLKPIRPDRVYFSSFLGNSSYDSPRAIAEALHDIRPQTEILFRLPKGADVPEWIICAGKDRRSWMREASCARVWVDNFNLPPWFLKRKGQFYVQTWHGDRGFKRMLYDANPKGIYGTGREIDLAVAGSDHAERLYRSAFRHTGEVLKVGMPRNDCLLHPLPIREAREKCGLDPDKKVLLFAPTFRSRKKAGEVHHTELDLEHIRQVLCASTGEEWIVITRAHEQEKRVEGGVRDFTDFPDMALLMQATDILLTDLSSCAGDFPLLNRKTVLWFGDALPARDLYYDMESTPYPIAHNREELDKILSFHGDEGERCERILDFFGTHETGRSAVLVAERIAAELDRGRKGKG